MDRMSSDLSTELKSCGKSVSVMSLWPGVVRTELMLNYANEAGNTLPIDINAHTESPEFTGRVLAEIAKESRADIMSRSGHVFVVADVASSKGIRDIDGRSPLSFRSYKFLLHYAGWKKVSACVPGCLKVPYFFLRPASPRF
uniref:Short chain dehydrogenase n=1 Tax=Mesocestoides corti TaxID=53468 RepID=A0A5K3F3M7_MESCO